MQQKFRAIPKKHYVISVKQALNYIKQFSAPSSLGQANLLPRQSPMPLKKGIRAAVVILPTIV
jgi:hypothetical protein